ncbi:hypothetical protein BJ138DRAFT_1137138 [Hygrophoropsis aurantiaca]|uniref:Uncharacterized protein n=1 Tax=Hygrophoropsis aurantiaca TaxID=72124 RepID=A0ACB8A5Q6_9AGAM|nr:hypothetical protein BJ138DRAFT_1137138 [Hygrophoropsis aurantiaca]
MFGLGRATAKASRKTSLPSVMASPVKGGGGDMTDTADEPGARPEDDVLVAALDLGSKSMTETSEAVDLDLTKTNEMNAEGSSVNGDAKQEENGSVKGKEKWPMNSSRRASMALQALSQSLSAMPQTPPKPVAIGTRTGLRSASSTYPAASSSGKKPASSSVKGKEKEKSGKDGAGKSGADASTNVNGSGGSGSKKGSLKLLKNCTIFVDVRTDDGDDAGSLFVDMLRGLGARILGRVGQSCTHIVFKNGLMSTLTRYRLLNDPKPLVVGIAWVVECVEQRTRVDEDKFKIDLDLVNVAGTNKRRRSMLPKHVLPPDDPAETSLASSERDDDRVSSEGRSSPSTCFRFSSVLVSL